MRRFFYYWAVMLLCQCTEKPKTYSPGTKPSIWTEEKKRKHFAQNFAFRDGWGNGFFENDTGETFIHFLNTHYPEVKTNHFHDAFLYALEEPYINTVTIDTTKHWLRLVITETFGNPFCLVVEKKNGKTYFTTKVTDGRGGYYTGNLRLAWTQIFPEVAYDSIINQFQNHKFWQMPIEDTTCNGGTDGSRWTVEAMENGKYQYVTRWSPEHCGDSLSRNLGKSGKQLKKMSRLEEMVDASFANNNSR